MTVGILSLMALLEVVIGVAIIATSKTWEYQILGTQLIGFGTLSIGTACLLSELRKAGREAEEERRSALQERQARAALNLKIRSGTISHRDREALLSESRQHAGRDNGSEVAIEQAIAKELQQLRSALKEAA